MLWYLGFWKYRVSGSCRDCLDQAIDRIGLYNYWTKKWLWHAGFQLNRRVPVWSFWGHLEQAKYGIRFLKYTLSRIIYLVTWLKRWSFLIPTISPFLILTYWFAFYSCISKFMLNVQVQVFFFVANLCTMATLLFKGIFCYNSFFINRYSTNFNSFFCFGWVW
jgi:hypothetical protein